MFLEKFARILILVSFVHRQSALPTEFQRAILSELGLDYAPNISTNGLSDKLWTGVSESCVNFFRTLNLINERYYDIRCFGPASSEQRNFTFPVESITSFDKFLLRIYQRNYLDDESYEKIYLKVSNDRREMKDENEWLEIDVTDLVEVNKQNVEFRIEYFVSNERGLRLKQVDWAAEPNHPPLLISLAKVKNSQRSKRQSDATDEDEEIGPYSTEFDDQSRYCEAVPIYYRFEDYGWDSWIISPKGFSSTFCQGRCSFPLKSDSKPTNHAIIQSLMQLMYPDRFPEPCCAPDQTESLQIVYFDKDNLPKFKRLDNMIIRSCRCT